MNSLGAELSYDLFPAITWTGNVPNEWPAADYPGLRPTGSWRLDPNGDLHGLDPDDGGWRDRETGEDVGLSDRHLVLAYGSNPDPNKLLDRREFLGDASVIALRAAVFGSATVWCRARRLTDHAVVATLASVQGRVEVHPVLALTDHQLDAMDKWEGHPNCYRRTRHRGPVVLESGELAQDVEVYLGTNANRPVLKVGGRYLLCAEVPYKKVDPMVPRVPR